MGLVAQTHTMTLGFEHKWQPIAVFLPGESHGQRTLKGYGPWDHSQTRLERLSTQACSLLKRRSQEGIQWGHGQVGQRGKEAEKICVREQVPLWATGAQSTEQYCRYCRTPLGAVPLGGWELGHLSHSQSVSSAPGKVNYHHHPSPTPDILPWARARPSPPPVALG